MRKFFKEFKEFISKGNVFDMAVGLIIATAFNKIVSSMVNDIIMPLVTWATGAASLADLSIVLRRNAEGVATLTWAYGNFIQTVIDFTIIALSVFLMVKLVTCSRRKFAEINVYIAKQSKKEVRAERKAVKLQAKQEGRKFKIVWAEHEAEKARLAEEQAKLEAAQKAEQEAKERALHPTDNDLLLQIRDLIKENQTKSSSKVSSTKQTEAKAETKKKK